MDVIEGKITGWDECGKITAEGKFEDMHRMALCGFERCRIVLLDDRRISAEQRRKVYALLAEISDWQGEQPEHTKRLFKLMFTLEKQREIAEGLFSLGDCDVTTANEFISYLVDFIIDHGVPCKTPLYELCEDTERYVYTCLKRKMCAVCGRKAQLHHVERVGMGRNRTEICHEGMEALPLCAEHHAEAHGMPDDDFMGKYHLAGIKLDKALCRVYALKARKVEE